uniref:CSON003164 protein n=1 Tax=Culicoides sonorensis TaxID=179676 RepID=A0A336LXB6_CULSO
MSNKPGSSRGRQIQKNSRLETVLQLAEILNSDSGAKCPNSDQNTEILQDILSTVKDIHKLLKDGLPSKTTKTVEYASSTPVIVKKPKMAQVKFVQQPVTEVVDHTYETNDANEYVTVYEETEDKETYEEDEEEPSVELGTSSLSNIEYKVEEVQNDDLKEFPMQTIADINWLEKEIGKIGSLYRNKIIYLVRLQQTKPQDYKATIRIYLRVIFSDALLYQYNWKGVNGKQPIYSLRNLLVFLRKLLAKWYPGTPMVRLELEEGP